MYVKRVLFFLAIAGGFFVYFSFFQEKEVISTKKDFQEKSAFSCENDIVEETKTIRGDSMYPLFKDGEEVMALMGHYECFPIEHGDVVLIEYAGNNTPLIKRVHGLPGNTFSFFETGDGLYGMRVNEQEVKNSEGKSYRFSEESIQEMVKYGKAYNYHIPQGRYLLLGETLSGSMDATRFGFLNKGVFLGKVVY
jgi:signal peptidase I